MKYQDRKLPENAVLENVSPTMTERTILKHLTCRHMAPVGKYGYLVTESGSLKFVWEDTGETFDSVPGHPVVIEPERFHHVEVSGPVKFHVEFYKVPGMKTANPDKTAPRPGESFSGCCVGVPPPKCGRCGCK